MSGLLRGDLQTTATRRQQLRQLRSKRVHVSHERPVTKICHETASCGKVSPIALFFCTSPRFKPAHLDARQRTTRPFPATRSVARVSERAGERRAADPRHVLTTSRRSSGRARRPPPRWAPPGKLTRRARARTNPRSASEGHLRGPRVRARRVLPGARQGRGPGAPDYGLKEGARASFRVFKSETRRADPGLPADTPRVLLTPRLYRSFPTPTPGRPHGGALGDQRGEETNPTETIVWWGCTLRPAPPTPPRARGLGAPLRRQRRPRLRRGDSPVRLTGAGTLEDPGEGTTLRWRLEGSTEDVDDPSTATTKTRRIPTSFTSRNPSRTPPGTSPCTR